MITVDTRGTTAYSPLIPAIKAMCNAVPGETLEIIMNHADAFQDLKEYLSEQSIGFRDRRNRSGETAERDVQGRAGEQTRCSGAYQRQASYELYPYPSGR